MGNKLRASNNFVRPPLDLPVEFALDFHLERNPDHLVFTHPTASGFTTYTYAEFVPAVHRTGQIITEKLQDVKNASASRTVVILLETDPLTYLTVLGALMRTGITAFPMSCRFSSTVVAHLLRESEPVAIIVNTATEFLAHRAINEYARSTDRPVIFEVPPLLSLYPGHNEYTSSPSHCRRPGDIAIITHSSSSTSAFPKIIPWSSIAITHHGEIEESPPHNLAGQILCGYGLEFFHSLGMCIFFIMVRQGLVFGIHDPSLQPASRDSDGVFRWLKDIRPNFIMTSPHSIEMWAEDKEKVDFLYNLGANIIYGGRFLRQSVGDMLARSGVKVSSAYGSTETGPISILPSFQADNWDYFTVTPRPDLIFVPREDDLLELVVSPVDSEANYLGAINTMWDGKPAYNPGDLFTRHPTKPHRYRMFGRLSDQILLSTGETINPVDIETELSKHPLIASAVMFGQYRPVVGVILDPAQVTVGLKEISSFLDAIFPTVEEINLGSPPYSSISRKMIIIASVTEKPISLSPKGLPRRPLVLKQYEDEIAALYRSTPR